MTTNTGLLVPINLTAYCLGNTDVVQAEEFAGATTWYSQMNANAATLGSNVVRSLHDDGPLWALEAGIHLHWAMPDALTHGTQSDTTVNFAALPNRWLLTRVLLQNKQPVTKAWVILSDRLSINSPINNREVPSLPVNDPNQNFRYVGVAELYTQNWVEPTIHPTEAIETLFGSSINPVASGDIAFASFYPNARNVFGFHDAMEDVEVPDDEAVEVMYTLVGWFADSSNDPMSAGLTLDELQTKYQWTYKDYPEQPPKYSLYQGQIENIQWNQNSSYINSTPIQADVAIGNNPAETLAAYFKGTNPKPLQQFEELFTAFEIGALTELLQPRPGQWSALLETLHAGQFSGHSGGTIYTIVESSSSNNGNRNVAGDIEPPLPVLVADALNLLNNYQQEYDLATIELQQYHWQLFAGWYRIIQVNHEHAASAYNALNTLLGLNSKIQTNYSSAQSKLNTQKQVVQDMLDSTMELQEQPAPTYLRPNEPTLLLAGELFSAVRRYGGDGIHDENGYLQCRLNRNTITAISVNIDEVKTLDASTFRSVDLPEPNHLNYAQDINNLREEACLLNTSFTATLLGGNAGILETNLAACLQGTKTKDNLYQSFAGVLPSPVAVHWADGNPWLPMFVIWQLNFYPIWPTVKANNLQDYRPDFFTGTFSVDTNNINLISYNPDPNQGGIDIDPAKINFSSSAPDSGIQQLKGASLLSPTAADNLAATLERYLSNHSDATLSAIAQRLQSTSILMQSLSGFNAALLMSEEALQLSISSTAKPGTPVGNFTKRVQQIIPNLSQLPPLVPTLNGFFNPLRTGFMQLSAQVVDVFGQKRPVQIDNLYIADTMATIYKGTPTASIIYLQPRLAQASRLLFRWLAADSTEYDEMNFHPATTPVCGWLLTNHLNGGFFIYNQQGQPLGSLMPNLDRTSIIWQSTPGDEETIDQTVEQVMGNQNPYLAEVVKMLAVTTPTLFTNFWTAVDKAAGLTTANSPDSQVGLGTLVGRPLALVQASLLLEQQGFPAYNLGWETLSDNTFIQTDNGLSTIQFTLVLGNIEQIDDGLIGYFKQGDGGDYDYTTFYTEMAPDDSKSGVVKPSATNLWVTPHATIPGDAPSVSKGEKKVLMLVDPRAGIHVSSGILPTQYLQIPPNQYVDTLRSLEMAFLVGPVLQPAGNVVLPLGAEENYIWSWIQESKVDDKSEWLVTADVGSPTANAVWSYTPQTVGEGWLRLNPLVLQFDLTATDGQRVIIAGTTVNLTLTVTNLLNKAITFTPASMIHEGEVPTGSIVFIHFGSLIEVTDVPLINMSASGWAFQSLSDQRYRNYWAATPMKAQSVTLEATQSFNIAVNQVKISTTASGQYKVYFDYYKVSGVAGDGVAITTLSIQDANT